MIGHGGVVISEIGGLSVAGGELCCAVPLPAQGQLFLLHDGFSTSFDAPAGEQRNPILWRGLCRVVRVFGFRFV